MFKLRWSCICRWCAGFVAALSLLACHPGAHAAPVNWNNPAGGDFSNSANWTPAVVPGAADDAVFNRHGAYTVDFTIFPKNNQLLVKGGVVTFDLDADGVRRTYTLSAPESVLVGATLGDNARLILTGGRVEGLTGAIGFHAGATGLVTVADATWANTGIFAVGVLGEGHLLVDAGGQVSHTSGFIGSSGGSTGAATVRGAWTSSSDLYIGNSGNGTLLVESGGQVSNTIGEIGSRAGSTGSATVRGTGSRWVNGGGLLVGSEGTGMLLIEEGAQVSNSLGFIGFFNDSSGAATVRGDGSRWGTTGLLVVGNGAPGTLLVETGGEVSNGDGHLGRFGGSTGSATVTGVGSTWANSGNLDVGGEGDGILTIADFGLVEVGGDIRLNGRGTINLDGGTLRMASATDVRLLGGQFNWDGGVIHITDPMGVSIGGSELFPAASALIGGQVLDVDHTLTVGSGRALLLDGGQIRAGTVALTGGHIVGTTLDLSLTDNLSGFGVVAAPIIAAGTETTITAIGTLSLGSLSTADGFDFGGTLNVGGHQVQLNDANRAQLGVQTTLAAGGRLGAINGFHLESGEQLSASGDSLIQGDFTNSGTVNGPSGAGEFLAFNDNVDGAGNYTGNIEFRQDVSPGNSAAQVEFAGDVLFNSSASLQIELGGTIKGSQYDALQIAGEANLDGALEVTLLGEFNPQGGDSFEVLRAEEGIFGEFASTVLPNLTGDLSWNVIYSNFSVLLEVAAPGLLGDYNGDGAVNAADYTVWRDGLGGEFGAGDYTVWKNNFGATGASGSAANTAVPEPSMLTLLAGLAMLCWVSAPRRSPKPGVGRERVAVLT